MWVWITPDTVGDACMINVEYSLVPSLRDHEKRGGAWPGDEDRLNTL